MGVRPLNEAPGQPGDECPNFLDAMELSSERAWGSLFNRQKAKVLLDPLLILGDDGEHVEEHTRNATTMPCPLSGGPDARDSAW